MRISDWSSDVCSSDLADDSSGAFEVAGIEVDVTAKSPDAARMAGFREAQRQGWKLLFARMTGKPVSASPSLSTARPAGWVPGVGWNTGRAVGRVRGCS